MIKEQWRICGLPMSSSGQACVGGSRLKLPHPSAAFFERFRSFAFFSFRRRLSALPPATTLAKYAGMSRKPLAVWFQPSIIEVNVK
jgi:hypothetical protein